MSALTGRLARWIVAHQISVRTGFAVTFWIGVITAVVGVLFSDTPAEFIAGVVLAGIGATGFDCIEWCER